MPNWINRYRIVKESVNGESIDWEDLMWTFIECSWWEVDFKLVNWSNLNTGVWINWNNKVALVMPLPFVWSNWTEGLKIVNWQKNTQEVMNYRWDNALVWFKNWKSGIIKVNIWSNKQSKTTEVNPQITTSNQDQKQLLSEILDPLNWYTVCQQMSIMDGWKRSCNFVWQSQEKQTDWGWRRYRFYVETNTGTVWVVDFKEDVTINQAIDIMSKNWIKNAAYADIIAYKMYFGDKNGSFFTREEGDDWESSYQKIASSNIILPNENSIIIRWQ